MPLTQVRNWESIEPNTILKRDSTEYHYIGDGQAREIFKGHFLPGIVYLGACDFYFVEEKLEQVKAETEKVLQQKTALTETSLVEKFIAFKSKHHVVCYNGRVKEIICSKHSNVEFKIAGMCIADNNADIGFIKTPKGKFYKVEPKKNRSARLIKTEDISFN